MPGVAFKRSLFVQYSMELVTFWDEPPSGLPVGLSACTAVMLRPRRFKSAGTRHRGKKREELSLGRAWR